MLLDHGHANAMRYPVGMVSVEASFVAKRLSVQVATKTTLLQMALSTLPNMNVKPAGTNRAVKTLKNLLKEMLDGE